ncbi:MAG: hypothetical protein AVDCRST_MAG75-1722 [uncultured Propionibacteriaceae bacterium]|uniref:Uncharacterized protein n=1 Tax=uncultured Propionibacteriaceae bacterium TaxID=257457 RepID=A0A6J4NSK3_9ACTN|nr:MAG: hypothetical protein AVDCRST_MAG75-1722 [uncultured Propionibacteriaceae bacterium]
MLRRLLLILALVGSVLLPLTGQAQAAGAADLGLTVRVPTGAVVNNLATRLPLSITWSAPACPHGCELFFVSCTDLQHNRVLDRVPAGASADARPCRCCSPSTRDATAGTARRTS